MRRRPGGVRRSVARIARFVLIAWASAVVLASMVSLLGQAYWRLDLLDHFRVQFAVLLTLAAGGQAFLRPRWLVPVWLIGAAVNAAIVGNAFDPTGAADASGPTLRVVHLNLDRDNDDTEAVLHYLRGETADAVFLQEVTPAWLTTLRRGLPEHRVVLAEPRDDSRGVALLTTQASPVRIEASVIQLRPGRTDRPTIDATIGVGDQRVRVLSLHVKRPANADADRLQRDEIAAAAAWSRRAASEGQTVGVIVIGDANATPWSSAMAPLREAKLRPATGSAYRPTWPSWAPALARIPIDVAYHSSGLRPAAYEIGPHVGSDHRPVSITWVLDG